MTGPAWPHVTRFAVDPLEIYYGSLQFDYNSCLLFVGHLSEERQCYRPVGNVFRKWEVAMVVPECGRVVRLQVYSRKIVGAPDTAIRQCFQNRVALASTETFGQAHNVDEPTHVHVGRDVLRLNLLNFCEQRAISLRNPGPVPP